MSVPGRAIVTELAPVGECESRTSAIREALSVRRGDLTFDVTGELLPEEQVLGCRSRAGPEHQTQEAEQVSEEGERRSKHVWR